MKRILTTLLLASALPSAAWGAHYYLYVGGYTGPDSKGIHAFRYDTSQAALEPLGTLAEMERPSFLAFSPDRRFLYAVSELGNDAKSEGYVYAYAIDQATGKLKFLSYCVMQT